MHTMKTQKILPTQNDININMFYIPCRIGDIAWGIRHRNGKPVAASGKVSEIFFVGTDMKLCIVVSKVVRGTWGVNVFATEKEAQEAITGGLNHE